MTTWQDVEKLFTSMDISCMRHNGLNLVSCEAVKAQQDAILKRVELPVDDPNHMPQGEPAWTAAQIDTFKSWIAAGSPCPAS